MKKSWVKLIGLSLMSGLLSFVVMALVRPTPGLAVTQAVLKVQSNMAGVNIANPTCYTVATGTCGTTNWTSKKTGGIPTTTYKYPLTATIGGTSYTLSANSLTGCNQGTSGSKPNICKVSVPGGSTATISANYILTPSPPPFSACTANLVQNPSFETINNSTARTWGSWQAWEVFSTNTNEVPNWKLSNPPGNWVFVINGGVPPAGLIQSAFDGTKHAVVLGHSSGSPAEGIIGDLSAPTTASATYELSAAVTDSGYPGTTNFEIRLRNSATGTESSPLTQAIGQQSVSWVLMHGHMTDNTIYDQVVLRYFGPLLPGHEIYGLIDDVHVCRVNPVKPWWQTPGVLGGLVLVLVTLTGGLIIRRTRHAKTGGSSKTSRGTVADFDGDGKAEKFKVAENESPGPLNRVWLEQHKKTLIVVGLVVAGSAIYIATAGGGAWKSKTNPATNNPATKTCVNAKHAKDFMFTTKCDSQGKVIKTTSSPIKQKTETTTTKGSVTALTPTPAKTCVDKKTVKEGYKLFRSDKYKYCIQYPSKWPVESSDPAKVTFGTLPDGEPGPGWLKVSHFSDKTVASRVKEIKANYKEPAGPCTETDTTLAGESGKKLDCVGAANGEHHIFYIVSEEGGNLFELSYIGDMSASNTSYDAQYKVMVNSFLCDMFANEQ